MLAVLQLLMDGALTGKMADQAIAKLVAWEEAREIK